MNNFKLTSIVPKTILGFVLAALLLTACETENSNEITPQTVATPTATPGSGQVADNTAITLATATEGAVIYFTQDGTEPSTASLLYSDSNKPVITSGKLTLKVISVKAGMNTSAVLTATYTITPITLPQTATTATPGSGQIADNTAIILSTAIEGAAIYFTQNGTEPSTASVLYSENNKPIITTGKLTLKAISVKAGMNASTVLTATYTLAPANTHMRLFRDKQPVKCRLAFSLRISTQGCKVMYMLKQIREGACLKQYMCYHRQHKPLFTPHRPLLSGNAFLLRGKNALCLPMFHQVLPITISRKTTPTRSFPYELVSHGI